jgi:class 3 adenylate cyclase
MTSSDMPTNEQQIASLEAGIRTLETQRVLFGDSVVDMAVQPLCQQLGALRKITRPSVSLNAERKLVTVIFADISGFTALSEKLDPEQVCALVNICFDCLVPDAFWNGPATMDALPARLRSLFSRSALVILKGDMNYRRLVGDILGPCDIPLEKVIADFPAPMAVLRTLKSGPLLGFDVHRSQTLDAVDSAWRANGQRRIIQFCQPSLLTCTTEFSIGVVIISGGVCAVPIQGGACCGPGVWLF